MISSLAVGFVNDKYFSNFHNTCFYGLYVIPQSRHRNHNGGIGYLCNFNLILSYTNRLDQDELFSCCIKDFYHIRSRLR